MTYQPNYSGSLGSSVALGSDCQIRAIFRDPIYSRPPNTGIWQSPPSKTIEIPEEPLFFKGHELNNFLVNNLYTQPKPNKVWLNQD